MLPLCRDQGIGVIPWSPLARGFLTGNRVRATFGDTMRAKTDDYARQLYFQEADFTIADRVSAVAEARGVKPAQVALAWLLQVPGVTAPIIGASKLFQLEEAVASLDIRLSAEEVASLEAPYQPHAVMGHV